MIDPQLEGKTVLITGANHGIGRATAIAFSSQGAKVFVTYFRPACRFSEAELKRATAAGIGGPLLYAAGQQQTAQSLLQTIRAAGGFCEAREADLADPSQIGTLFDTCEATLGPVDILVNNHTCSLKDTFDPDCRTEQDFGIHPATTESIDAHFAVNARAYALMMSEYLRRCLDRKVGWGRIINVSTDAAHAHPASVSYAASKHAIESYTRSAALEMGKYGITVNVVAPGPIQTGWLSPEDEKKIAETTPLGRTGRPEDVADVIVLLASQQAHWLTGQLLYVGGGWRMHQ
jgi:3-oxoacyl-[acyl-carrier protein] reductase